MVIKIETFDNKIIEGELLALVKLNKIARDGCMGLTYLMNVIDINSKVNQAYMWFKNDRINVSYLVEI